MPMKPGRDAGGHSVYQLPDGKIIPPVILVDEYGNLARISAGIPDPKGVVNVAITDTPTRKAFPNDAKKCFFYATSGFYYKFGNADVTVDNKSSQLPSGVGEFNIGSYTHISVMRIVSDGNLNITKMD